MIRALAPYDAPWPELKERYTEQILAICDRHFPASAARSTSWSRARHSRSSASPATTGRRVRLGEPPAQAGNRRLPHELGIDGLYLTGHWTQEGTGSLRVLFSGVNVATEILEHARFNQQIPDFRKPRGGAVQADEDRKALVRRFFDEVWNQGRFEFMDECYAPDFKLHALWENTALGGSGDADIEGAKGAIRGWRAGFPDLRVTVEEQVVEGEMVTSRHFAVGTNDRAFRASRRPARSARCRA